ncbi:MAG TPA: hypothetical protein VEI03_04095 [Stellaceae bacterium]|nr:hypothetical protein [Stellaceae bacterium]
MSDASLRLVHNRPFVGQADDLAVALLLSFVGLMAQLAVAGLGSIVLSL